MITFLNAKYSVYILCGGFIALMFFLVYSWMRRRIIRTVTGLRPNRVVFINGSYAKLMAKDVLAVLAIISVTVALLGPGWGEEEREKPGEGTDLLIALDVSRSMLATDAQPSRLERAKGAVKLIAESLNGDRIGLILFSGDSFLQCPLTADIGAFMMFLDSAGPESVSIEGTDMGRMFKVALHVFEKKRLTSRMLVVITDGEDNEGGAVSGADMLKEAGIEVYALGVGSVSGEYIPRGTDGSYYRNRSGELIRTRSDQSLLKKLASDTGGTYSDITGSFSGIGGIISAVERQQKNSTGRRKVKEKKDRSWIFILLAVIFMGAEVAIPAAGRFHAKNG